MTDATGALPPEPSDEERRAERVSALGRLYDADGPVDPAGALYWPDLTPAEARGEWASMRA